MYDRMSLVTKISLAHIKRVVNWNDLFPIFEDLPHLASDQLSSGSFSFAEQHFHAVVASPIVSILKQVGVANGLIDHLLRELVRATVFNCSQKRHLRIPAYDLNRRFRRVVINNDNAGERLSLSDEGIETVVQPWFALVMWNDGDNSCLQR